MKQNSEIDCAYGLQLADGSLWKLTGTKAVSGWLAELAHILGCGPFSQTPTHAIHFHGVKDLSIPPRAKPCFIETGVNEWTPFKNGGIQRVWRHAHRPEIHVELREAFLDHEEIRYINMWSALRELHRHALSNGGTPVHAALAALDGKGVLIAGTGGTGKSTCYSRLPNPWNRICDDQALILRMEEEHFRVHPLPTWSDVLQRESKQRWPVERSVPLKAVFLLEQASKDEVLPIKASSEAVLKYLEAAKQVWKPVWSKADRNEKKAQSAMLFGNVARMARVVPAYRLRATLDGTFWEGIEKAVCG